MSSEPLTQSGASDVPTREKSAPVFRFARCAEVDAYRVTILQSGFHPIYVFADGMALEVGVLSAVPTGYEAHAEIFFDDFRLFSEDPDATEVWEGPVTL